MPRTDDPTDAIRKAAAAFPGVLQGTSCSQTSYKAGKGTFLFIGPGARGQGFKALFKLDRSRGQAEKLAASQPDRFEVGATGWVTARFTAEKPLPAAIWRRWLRESYELTCGPAASGGTKAAPARKAKKPPARKKAGTAPARKKRATRKPAGR